MIEAVWIYVFHILHDFFLRVYWFSFSFYLLQTNNTFFIFPRVIVRNFTCVYMIRRLWEHLFSHRIFFLIILLFYYLIIFRLTAELYALLMWINILLKCNKIEIEFENKRKPFALLDILILEAVQLFFKRFNFDPRLKW